MTFKVDVFLQWKNSISKYGFNLVLLTIEIEIEKSALDTKLFLITMNQHGIDSCLGPNYSISIKRFAFFFVFFFLSLSI